MQVSCSSQLVNFVNSQDKECNKQLFQHFNFCMLEFTHVYRRPCHQCHCHRIFSFTAFEMSCKVASTKVSVNSLGLSSASQEQSCSCSALLWPHPHSENGLSEGWEQLGGKLTDKLAGWGKAGWGQLLLRCLGFTSAGHSSAEQPEEVGASSGGQEQKYRLWWKAGGGITWPQPLDLKPLPFHGSDLEQDPVSLRLQSHSYQWIKQTIEQMF